MLSMADSSKSQSVFHEIRERCSWIDNSGLQHFIIEFLNSLSLQECNSLRLSAQQKCIEALSEHVVCLKRLKTSAFGSSEPLLLLRLMGVSVPSLHIECTDSMIVGIHTDLHSTHLRILQRIATVMIMGTILEVE